VPDARRQHRQRRQLRRRPVQVLRQSRGLVSEAMRRLKDIRTQRGQTMVEVAMVLPVLCLLLFGVIQMGILFNNYVTLTDAVRAGARKAAVSRPLGPSGAVAAAQDAVRKSAGDLDQSKLPDPSVTSTWQHGDDVT